MSQLSRPIELCAQCDMDTGNAGEGEDSLYFGDEGPLCEDCHDFMDAKFRQPWKTKEEK